MRKYSIGVCLLCLFLLIGCATTQDTVQTGLLVGASVKETAEASYCAIRDAWHKDAVSDEDMAKAVELYQNYEIAMLAYSASLKAYEAVGSEADLITSEAAVLDAVAKLVQLAEHLGVIK